MARASSSPGKYRSLAKRAEASPGQKKVRSLQDMSYGEIIDAASWQDPAAVPFKIARAIGRQLQKIGL
jgi:hypothetical protein